MIVLKYGVKNFFCFREAINVSFMLGANCPKSVSNGKNYTNILGVKGANASGKTNVLKALAFLSEFCCNSFSYKPESRIFFESFFSSKDPTEFYIDFEIDKIQYRYELSLTREMVLSEKIFRKKIRTVKIIERINERLEHISSDHEDLKSIKIRNNASLISTAHQYEIKSLNKIYTFFRYIISNVTFLGYAEDGENRHLNISDFYHEHKNIFDVVKDIIKKCDTGISDIEIKSKKDENDKVIYYPIFIHPVDGKPKKLTYSLESSGTKSLYNQLGAYVLTLKAGGVLILDEFDIYLHPHLLPLLLNLFIDPKLNKNNAQLIFTTHNSEILDYLGKYRTIFINKQDNESFGYRLDEIPGDIVRNDRSIVPLYDAGKIGGVGNYDL